jgi:hypothetical protein
VVDLGHGASISSSGVPIKARPALLPASIFDSLNAVGLVLDARKPAIDLVKVAHASAYRRGFSLRFTSRH